jgi:hypothetical protein
MEQKTIAWICVAFAFIVIAIIVIVVLMRKSDDEDAAAQARADEQRRMMEQQALYAAQQAALQDASALELRDQHIQATNIFKMHRRQLI